MRNMLISRFWLFAIFFIRPGFGYAQLQNFVIGGVNYFACQPPETVVAPFASTEGSVTANQYSGFVLIKVSGTGQSAGTSINSDAFYFNIQGTPTHDPDFFQLVITIGTSVFEAPAFPNTAYRHIVYDVDAGAEVTPPYVPPFRTNNTYTFIINMNTLVPAPVGPSILRFGISDGVVIDNSGSFIVEVTPLSESCPPPLPQLTQEWVARFNGSGNSTDRANSLAVDKDGNVYITGTATGTGTGLDLRTIKYNAKGVIQWKALWNGSANGDDEAFSIAVDCDGNAYVTGRSAGNGTSFDYVTVKYNSSGSRQWSARYNGPANGPDLAKSIVVDDDGNVYITGESQGNGTFTDFATIKYNKYGKRRWVARYTGPGLIDFANALVLDKAGNVYVTGASNTGVDTDNEDLDFTTIKYNKSGQIVWLRRLGNFGAVPTAIAIDAMDNIYITGSTALGERDTEYTTVKYDKDGNKMWVATFNPPPFSVNIPLAIAVDELQNAYITGRSASGPEEQNFDFATVKYDVNGQQVWANRYNGPANSDDLATGLALDASGNVYVTGISQGDIATIKYNTAGETQSVTRYNGPGNGTDGPAGFFGFPSRPIVVANKGNVYITGFSIGISSGFDMTTIKYSQPCEPSPGAITGRTGQPAAAINTIPASFRITVAPNPAVTTAKIFYELPVDGRVSLQVFDMLGRQVTTLVDAVKQAGTYNADLNVATLQKGIYYYRITVRTISTVWSQTGKVSVVK